MPHTPVIDSKKNSGKTKIIKNYKILLPRKGETDYQVVNDLLVVA